MRFRLLFLILLFQGINADAQLQNLQVVRGLPTEEVFDLFSDSKGFIWMSHTLGISRYDGIKFTHFSSAEQTTTGTSGICEDQKGRIWFYNFNGQLFYIEKEKMKLFEAYNIQKEQSYPSLLPLDSEIVVTTDKGLFVCNTTTMKGRYYHTEDSSIIARSICVYRDHILAGTNKIYRYDAKNGFKKIPLSFLIKKSKEIPEVFSFAKLTTNDTIYAYNNERTWLYKIIERRDSLFVLSAEKMPGTFKTIIKCDDSIWVNTQNVSYKLNSKDSIFSQYLSDIVIDKWKNKWYSSLQEGLRKTPAKYKGWQKREHAFLEKNDFVRTILPYKGMMVYGTQGGKIYITKDDKLLHSYHIDSKAGSIENVIALPNGNFLVAPSKGVYQINTQQNYILEISSIASLKNVVFTDSSMLLAYSQMLSKVSLTPNLKKYLFEKGSANNLEYQKEFIDAIENHRQVLRYSRCNILNTDEVSKKVYANFKSGLALIEGDSIKTLSFNGKQISGACMVQYNKEAYVGTFDNGLMIIGEHGMANFSINSGLISNIVLKIKRFHNHLFLIEPGYVQIFDLLSPKIINTIPIPLEINGTVYDFYEENEQLYLAMKNKEYRLSLSEIKADLPEAYLLSASNTISQNEIEENAILSSKENAIQFKLSSPSYINPEATQFIYQLIGSNDESWKTLIGPDYTVSFASLNPGKYSFRAYAVNFQGERSKNTINFKFTINYPWWLQWWFISLLVLLVIALSSLILTAYFKGVKRRDRHVIEKLTLQNELRKSLLKTIVTQMNPHFIFNALNTIQSFVYKNDKRSVSNYMGKFSELIRKILDTSNINSISLKEEIAILELYLDLEKARFESEITMELVIDPEMDLENIEIPPMFIQPCIENAIKHGLFHKKGSRNLKVSIEYDDPQKEYIRIEIDDDGIGRSRSRELNKTLFANHRSFASSAMESRVDLINQTLEKKISLFVFDKEDQAGTKVIIRLPINSTQYD
ncbi:MAG: histidine kinase [Bacteroidetes bacterium]|nr:histidine kinase [Bacteroidota bacterium]